MALKAARAKWRRKATGRSEGLAEELGESGSARGSNGEGTRERRQERVRKGEKSGYGRCSNGLWSRGDIVRGRAFDGTGGKNHAPSSHAMSRRNRARPRHTNQLSNVNIDGYA